MSPQIALSNFVNFIRDNIQRIAELYREIEEVQVQFNSLYTGLKGEWQELVEKTAAQLASGEPPATLRVALQAYQQQERRSLENRIAELQKQVAEKQAAADQALREAQAELAKLRKLNPLLNEREESLKAKSLAEQAEISKLQQEWRKIGPLGRAFGHRALKEKLLKARQEHERTLQALREVREEWVRKKQEAEERQDKLRTAWEAAQVALSQARAELDYLSRNLDELAAQRGAQRFLAELKEAPPADGELNKALARIAEMNRELEAYQGGLTSVAEALGALTGIRTGMERFKQSVDKVYEEQVRFNLRPLQLEVPRSVVEFHNTWAAFRSRVKDDKYLGRHPLEFSQVVSHYVKNVLTEEAIKEMFEGMGRALETATKSWEKR